jgi:tRNA threonylcarbamoyladenosine biosynthesis protein TsaE
LKNGGAAVLSLSGELGAGKTTFTQALAEALGVMETVTSPTFVVMKRYPTQHETFQTLVHIDLYRIDDVSELVPLRIKEELANPRSLVVVEWPERAPGAIPMTATPIAFTVGEANSRTITYGA